MIKARSGARAAAVTLLLASAGCGGQAADEPGWRAVPSLQSQGWLVSTTASPSGEVWLAFGGTPAKGQILRAQSADKDLWTAEQTPDVPLLNWGQVFEDKTAVVVGNAGTILRFDGTLWSLQPAPSREDLWGVWGARSDDVWAVGGAGLQDGQATVLHYDGATWQAVLLPALQRPNVWAFFKVWGASADDVYVVGQNGAMLHFDGSRWGELGVGIGDDLIAIYGVGHDRIAVVGGRSSGVVATFDGGHWTTKQLAPLPGLNGVWMGTADTIHVAGIDGTLAELDFATLTARAQYQRTDMVFHALHGAGSRLLAVGGNLGATAAPYLGLARERTLEAP